MKAGFGTILLIVALGAMLIGAGYFAYQGLALPGEMPGHFIVAMVLGIVLSIIVGAGLMALVFHSSRRGYDEPPDFRK